MRKTFLKKGSEYKHVVKTGRTHLMDAMPITFEQEFSGYARQIEMGINRIESILDRIPSNKIVRMPSESRLEGGDVIIWNEYIFVGYSEEKDFNN